jgi:hypothetical protein
MSLSVATKLPDQKVGQPSGISVYLIIYGPMLNQRQKYITVSRITRRVFCFIQKVNNNADGKLNNNFSVLIKLV